MVAVRHNGHALRFASKLQRCCALTARLCKVRGADLCVTQARASLEARCLGGTRMAWRRHSVGRTPRVPPGRAWVRPSRCSVGVPWRVRANTSPRTLRSQPAAHDRAREPRHDGLELLGGGRALGVGGLAAADSGAPTTAARRPAALRGGWQLSRSRLAACAAGRPPRTHELPPAPHMVAGARRKWLGGPPRPGTGPVGPPRR